MDVRREHISHILELREIPQLFQTAFNLVNATAVCAVLESISGLEPLSVMSDCPKFLPTYINLCVDSTDAVCHQLGLLGTGLHALGCGGFVRTLN